MLIIIPAAFCKQAKPVEPAPPLAPKEDPYAFTLQKTVFVDLKALPKVSRGYVYCSKRSCIAFHTACPSSYSAIPRGTSSGQETKLSCTRQ